MMSVAKSRASLIFPESLMVKFFVVVSLLVHFSPVLAATEKVVQKTPVLDSRPSVMGGESVLSIVLSLILVVALIFVMAWFMRRMGGTSFRSNSFLKIVGGVSMGARERIVLVQVGEEQLLIGIAPGRIQTLHKLEKPLQANESRDSAMPSFSDRLKTIINKEK